MGKLAKLTAGMVTAAAGVLLVSGAGSPSAAQSQTAATTGVPPTQSPPPFQATPAPAQIGRPPLDPKLLESEPAVVNGYLKLDFDRLADFPFVPVPVDLSTAKPGVPPPSSASQIPAAIKKLDGRRAIVTGCLLPLKIDHASGLVTEFFLNRTKYYYFDPPVAAFNEWVVVRLTKGVEVNEVNIETPVSFTGTFHVREEFEDGYLTSIYQLDGGVGEVAKP